MYKNLPDIFKESILSKPGDSISARITKGNRKVIKINQNDGNDKYSATQYPNGTIVETRTRKPK